MRRSALGGAISHSTADLLKMANKSGFDCEFEEKPSKGVQSECPVCLLVLREPYQATCCGYGFCRVCIERVRAENKPCPCCNTRKFDCFEDKGRRRSLYDFKVHCSNKRLGCQWVGELGELENHLNSNPSQDEQLEGCQYTQVKCLHCSEPFRRSDVDLHQNDQCLKRPFSCEHCKDYDASYEDVTTNHWPVCGSCPVQCPNKCSNETIERQDLNSHLANDCPLAVVDCDFKGVGCEVRLPRKDLSTHLNEGLVAHVSLQTRQLMDLREENQQLKQQVETLKKDFWEYKTGSLLCPVELTMTNYEQLKMDDDEWQSSPFYTHPKGYKMCLVVWARGRGDGANTHLSLCLKLMKGEYDDELKWRFQGKFIVQLLNQGGDAKHLTKKLVITFDADSSDHCCGRVLDGELAKQGRGQRKFLSLTELKPTYLQNDSLKFCVKKVD